MSVKAKLVRLLGSKMLKSAVITAVQDLGGGLRRLELRSEILAPPAGSKLQLLLDSEDMRTYSPIAVPGGFALLDWVHGGGPGARWLAGAQLGDALRFVGPQRSLELPAGRAILAGDESSVAVAAALADERPGDVQAVFEAGDVEGVRAACVAVGLRNASVAARGDVQAMLLAVLAARTAAPDASIALTGGSELIVALRAALRAQGVSGVKTKTYWIPGRTGLD